jgi:cytochrome c-type biogenesis protein CcmE
MRRYMAKLTRSVTLHCVIKFAALRGGMTENNIKPARVTPPHRNRRIRTILSFGLLSLAGLYLIFSALGKNTEFFYNPSDVVADGFVPGSEIFRMGGLVVEGSVIRKGGVLTEFTVADFERDMDAPITVIHDGVLPDLFKEGQGVVVSGKMNADGVFIAREVLAKHDENYQPKINYQDETS